MNYPPAPLEDEPPRKILKLDDGYRDGRVLDRSKCNICCLPHSTEDCPIISSGQRVTDANLPSKAILTIPATLESEKCEDGTYKIIAKTHFANGTQFGPLDAPKSETFNPACSYLLQVLDGDRNMYLDTSDEAKCNWMILVPFSNDVEKRNCICYQLKNEIYFTTVKNISEGESLIVGYSPGYENLLEELKIINTTDSQLTSPEGSDIINEMEDSHSMAEEGLAEMCEEFDELQDYESSYKPDTPTEFDSIGDFPLAEFDENDKETSEESEDNGDQFDSTPSVEVKRKKLLNRVGAVLARDEWKCKFCSEVHKRIINFATHLIEHYKSVGAAKTEKSRLRKINEDPVLPPVHQKEQNIFSELGDTDLMEVGKSSGSAPMTCPPVVKDEGGDAKKKTIPKYPYVCDLCAKKRVFNRAEYIIRHLMKHNRPNYCHLCRTIFPERNELNDHVCDGILAKMTKETTRQTFHRCRFCSESFNAYSQLRHHLKLHHGDGDEDFHKCDSCTKLFSSTTTLRKHVCSNKAKSNLPSTSTKSPKSVAGQRDDDVMLLYKCGICDETFPRLIVLEKHLKSHGCAFACTLCKKSLTHQTMNSHMNVCELEQAFSSNSINILKCPKCIEVFDELDPFRYHVVQHTHPSMCPACNLRFTTPKEIRAHKCVQFQCDGCESVVDNLIDFKSHIINEHGKVHYFCFECALPFVTQDGFSGHTNCDPKTEKKERQKSEKESRIFVCETCGVTYTKWTSMKTHKKIHSEKKYKCETCGKEFHRKEILIEHEFTHKDAQFECPTCPKKFKSKKTLEVHSRIHDDTKKFACKDCSRKFSQKVNLLNHQITHLPPEEKGFACKYCHKKFASKEYLGFHIEAHEKGKHQVCELCGKSFVKYHMLVQHKKIAHAEQKYSCEFCNSTVRRKHSLLRHLKNRHPELENVWAHDGYLESRVLEVQEEVAENTQTVGETDDLVSDERSDNQDALEKRRISTRAKIMDPFMNQSSKSDLDYAKFDGKSSSGPMILVEFEEGSTGELVFTLEDSTGDALVQEAYVDEADGLL